MMNIQEVDEQDWFGSSGCMTFKTPQNPGVAVSVGESTTIMSKFEYADDAALTNADAATATARVTALAAGSITDAAMVISQAKSKVMHIHRKTHVSSTTEVDGEALKLAHKCNACSRRFPTQRGLKIHAARCMV